MYRLDQVPGKQQYQNLILKKKGLICIKVFIFSVFLTQASRLECAIKNITVMVLKFQTLFFFCSEFWLSGWNSQTHGRIADREDPDQTAKTLIRLLLQKQSDRGLPCL